MTGSGALTVTGQLTWNSGLMSGSGSTTVASTGALAVVGVSNASLTGRTLVLNGPTTLTSGVTGNVFLSTGAEIVNNSTFDFQTDGSIFDSGGSPKFTNNGTVTKSGGNGGTAIVVDFENSTGGTLKVDSGTVILSEGGTSAGAITVASGAILNFPSNSYSLIDPGSFAGTGTLSVSGASVTDNTTTSLAITTLNVTAGTLTLNNPSTTVTTATLTSGTLAGSGPVTVIGVLSWSGGTMSGTGSTTVAATGALDLPGTNTTVLQTRSLILNGPTTFEAGANDLFVQDNAPMVNNDVFTFLGDRNIFLSTGSPTFTNSGTVRKTGGSGTTTISIEFDTPSVGTLDVTSGTVNLAGGGTDAGTITVAAGTRLNFGGGNHVVTGASTFTDAGALSASVGTAEIDVASFPSVDTLEATGGALTLNSGTSLDVATLSISSGSITFNIPSAAITTATLSGGTLGGSSPVTVAAVMTWSGGTMAGTGSTTVSATGSLDLPGTNTTILQTRQLILNGPTTFEAGANDLFVQNNAPIVNNDAFTFLGDRSIFLSTGSPTFTNTGTVRKTGGSGTTTISIGFDITTGGFLTVESGTLSLPGGGTSAGAITVASGATLNFPSNSYSLIDPGSFAGTGTLSVSGASVTDNTTTSLAITTLNVAAGTLTLNNPSTTVTTATLTSGTLAGSGPVTVTGVLSWSGGTMSGTGSTTVAATGALDLPGTNTTVLQTRSLILNGPTTFEAGANDLFVQDNAPIVNNDVFTFLGDRSIFLSTGSPTFTNNKTVQKTGGLGISSIGIAFANAFSGLVTETSGTLSFGSPGLTNAGHVDVGPNTALTVSGTFVQTAGLTSLPANGTLGTTGGFFLEGGVLEGTGTITGNVTNTGGAVSPGFSPGVLSITGNFNQGPGGSLTIELGGTVPGSDFDRVNVGGNAVLDGALDLHLIGGFFPSASDSFVIVTASAVNGAFATVSGNNLGNGSAIVPQVNPDNVTLLVAEFTPTVTTTPTETATVFDTATSTVTDTATETSTSTDTPTASPTATATLTETPSETPTETQTATGTTISTSTETSTQTATSTPTDSPTQTSTATSTSTVSPTSTPTDAATFTSTSTLTPSSSSTATGTSQPTSTMTLSPTSTPTSSSTSTSTTTPTSSSTLTPSSTLTTTEVPTETASATASPSASSTVVPATPVTVIYIVLFPDFDGTAADGRTGW